MPGLKKDTSACKTFEELPIEAQNYIDRIEELLHIPIYMIAVGPKREQTILRSELI